MMIMMNLTKMRQQISDRSVILWGVKSLLVASTHKIEITAFLSKGTFLWSYIKSTIILTEKFYFIETVFFIERNPSLNSFPDCFPYYCSICIPAVLVVMLH